MNDYILKNCPKLAPDASSELFLTNSIDLLATVSKNVNIWIKYPEYFKNFIQVLDKTCGLMITTKSTGDYQLQDCACIEKIYEGGPDNHVEEIAHIYLYGENAPQNFIECIKNIITENFCNDSVNNDSINSDILKFTLLPLGLSLLFLGGFFWYKKIQRRRDNLEVDDRNPTEARQMPSLLTSICKSCYSFFVRSPEPQPLLLRQTDQPLILHTSH